MAARTGLEPMLREPKSRVLPTELTRFISIIISLIAFFVKSFLIVRSNFVSAIRANNKSYIVLCIAFYSPKSLICVFLIIFYFFSANTFSNSYLIH